MLTIDPTKRPSLAEMFKDAPTLEAYRAWATDQRTVKFLALVADLLTPTEATNAEIESHPVAVKKLTVRETLESAMLTAFRLEDIAFTGGEAALPPSTYEPPRPVRETGAR